MGTAIDISHLRSIKDRFSFEGKKGFVTGAAGGIGRSTAAALAELGADVALVDINLERARQNAEEINKRFGTHCIALRCDVSDPNSVSTMMAEVLRAYGEVNFVHSNAGIISPDDNGDMPLESWNRMLGVNLTGMMLVDQAAAHQMKAQGKGGAVVNTASMSARSSACRSRRCGARGRRRNGRWPSLRRAYPRCRRFRMPRPSIRRG